MRSFPLVDHIEDASDEPVDRPQLSAWRRGARLEPRQLEQVRHEALESPDLREDRRDELVSIRSGE